MGQGLSYARTSQELEFFTDLAIEPALLRRTTVYDGFSALHIAAAHGRMEVLRMLLDRSVHPDSLNRHRQTPLMLAAMNGKICCVEELLQAGANNLPALRGYHGHADCLEAILSAAKSTPISGLRSVVNVRDGDGATPLHLAARRRRPECVHFCWRAELCFAGSTPLHAAARGGSLDCIFLHPLRYSIILSLSLSPSPSLSVSRRMPYLVALKRHHRACAAVLNPSTAEPLVWPSPLKLVSELPPDAKALLERALVEANMEREKTILRLSVRSSPPPPAHSGDWVEEDESEEGGSELCSICFSQPCTITIGDCGHQMCARCTLALCCHSKPGPAAAPSSPVPVCPFAAAASTSWRWRRRAVARRRATETAESCPEGKQQPRMPAFRRGLR
ncbi:unnamed protein product [Spirodela intermedia]|uniref:RING-type E3 ubiquitin transferase n=1 Tax=Spirodela intermedia TaxID=51605 RepID=A0A7I8IH42_SPIIN|nr:unnamed protein product [Spirodela intermedia]CAA6656817.1 unnamed protein product [Spirodela intermedia]